MKYLLEDYVAKRRAIMRAARSEAHRRYCVDGEKVSATQIHMRTGISLTRIPWYAKCAARAGVPLTWEMLT